MTYQCQAICTMPGFLIGGDVVCYSPKMLKRYVDKNFGFCEICHVVLKNMIRCSCCKKKLRYRTR